MELKVKPDFWESLNKPKWMSGYSYLTIMGSRAYGSATEDSDYDFYGFVVPPKEIVFPYLAGDIPERATEAYATGGGRTQKG